MVQIQSNEIIISISSKEPLALLSRLQLALITALPCLAYNTHVDNERGNNGESHPSEQILDTKRLSLEGIAKLLEEMTIYDAQYNVIESKVFNKPAVIKEFNEAS